MKIISISIYSDDYQILFQKNIDEALNTAEVLTISSFLNGLNKFARETFAHSLTRVDLETIWIDFIYSEEFIIVLVTEIPNNLRERIAVMYDKIILEMENFLHNILHKKGFNLDTTGIELLSTLLEMKLSAITKMKMNSISNITEEIIDDDWEIDMGFVCEQSSGIPIIYNSYGGSEVDPILISSMLSMFSSFSHIEFNRRIRLIHLENLKLVFKLGHSNERLYIMVVNSNTDLQKSIPDKIFVKVHKILNQIAQQIDELFNSTVDVDDDTMSEIMDTSILQYL